MPISQAEAISVTLGFIRDYPSAIELAYKFREDTFGLYGRHAAKVPQGMKGGYIPQRTIHAGRNYRGRVDVPLQNIEDSDDLLMTLRHEVLGHYGVNTFAPVDKRALVDGLILAREEPSLKPYWNEINRRYADVSLDMRAEEVVALHCESITPDQHMGLMHVQDRGKQSFIETCVERVRPMQADDLHNIMCMVADGLHERSRVQQTFPHINELFRKEETMESKKQFHEIVAEKLIGQLETGTAPWQKPWLPGELSLPYNAATGKDYRGLNSMWLAIQGYSDPRWMTYNQASDAGAQVRRGATGTKVSYLKFSEERQARDEHGEPIHDENGKPKMVTVNLERPRAFHAVVFNAEQIDGLPPLQPKQQGQEPERHARAEAILANSGANIQHVEGNRAFYRSSTDSITLPERHQFLSADNYYATALHELGHWTGHPSRLDRDLAHPFGSEGYAREELRAEIASLMLGERLGIGHDPGQHAAYVGSWIKALKEDPREIFRAASDAEKIATYVMDFEVEKNHELIDSIKHQDTQTVTRTILHEQPEVLIPSRTYLAVPYSEKEQAKASAKSAGFHLQWDKDAKSWFAPEGANLSGMEKWMVGVGNIVKSDIGESPESQFSRALKESGLIVDGLPIMDGNIHRVPVDGDRGGKTSGAYVGHTEGRIPGGYIQNYKTGVQVNWKAEGRVDKLSPEEHAKLAAETAQRQQRRHADLQAKYQAASRAATALWAESSAASADDAYCKAKHIENPGAMGLRVVPDTVSPQAEALGIKIAKTVKEAKALRDENPDARVFKAGDLLVPGYDEKGKLWTLQSINPTFKSFMKGGRKQGLFTVAGANPDGKSVAELLAEKSTPLLIVEGYATGDAVASLSGQPVVVAFDSGNLDVVAKTLRDQFPQRTMIIAADNDHNAENERGPDGKPRVNVGLVQAKGVAEKYGAGVAAPQFKAGEKASDWNDLRAMKGDEEARKLLAEQLTIAKYDAAIISERLTTLARTRDMEARNDPTTSSDDVYVATERGKAASMMISASEQNSQVRNASADGMLGGKGARPTTSARAGVERKAETLRDIGKSERQEVLNPAQAVVKGEKEKEKKNGPSRQRARGFDAGF